MWTFKTALFGIAKKEKQPKYPSTEKWKHTFAVIYTMVQGTAVKMGALKGCRAPWMNLKNILLSNKTKEIYGMSPFKAFKGMQNCLQRTCL